MIMHQISEVQESSDSQVDFTFAENYDTEFEKPPPKSTKQEIIARWRKIVQKKFK